MPPNSQAGCLTSLHTESACAVVTEKEPCRPSLWASYCLNINSKSPGYLFPQLRAMSQDWGSTSEWQAQIQQIEAYSEYKADLKTNEQSIFIKPRNVPAQWQNSDHSWENHQESLRLWCVSSSAGRQGRMKSFGELFYSRGGQPFSVKSCTINISGSCKSHGLCCKSSCRQYRREWAWLFPWKLLQNSEQAQVCQCLFSSKMVKWNRCGSFLKGLNIT